MGYVHNFYPSKRWFCGREFLIKSKLVLEKLKVLDVQFIDLDILSELILARINVLRGIRSALLLPPDDDSKNYVELLDELKVKMKNLELFLKLKSLFNKDFNVKFYGYVSYGVLNYEFISKEGQKVSLCMDVNDKIPNNAKELVEKAFLERIRNLEDLLNIAYEIFFEEVYLIDRRESFYEYSFDDLYELSDLASILVNYGLYKTEEEVIKKFEGKEETLCDMYSNILEKDYLEQMKYYHEDVFWEWSEIEAVLKSNN
jgi:hypothetical protein